MENSMKETAICEAQRVADGRSYRYTLLSRQGSGAPQYDVSVVGESGRDTRSARVCGGFSSEREARDFFTLVVEHLCSPIHLSDVYEDSIAQKKRENA